MIKPFWKKDNEKLPDNYEMKIIYLDDKIEQFEVASHLLHNNILEFVTKEDVWNVIPMTAVKRLGFDKRFSKIMALKKEQAAKEQAKENT